MNTFQARKLAQYHIFTKRELFDILHEAYETYTDDYWKKPNSVNAIFDNGYYFNQCIKWVGYKEGVNDDSVCLEIVTVRVLQVFGKFSKVQLPKKVKPEIKIIVSQPPSLTS